MKNKLYFQFAGSCFLLFFAFLSYVIKFYPNWVQGFDTLVTSGIRSLPAQATPFFLWITKFANPNTVIILGITLTIVFIYGKQWAEFWWLFLGIGSMAGVINPLLKLFFERERPDLVHLVVEHSFSFPSGHALTSMILYGSLLLILPVFISNRTLCQSIQILLGLLILLIGCSRIYLGVHFPTDIIGGFSLGLSWLLLTFPIYEKRRFIWRFQNKQR